MTLVQDGVPEGLPVITQGDQKPSLVRIVGTGHNQSSCGQTVNDPFDGGPVHRGFSPQLVLRDASHTGQFGNRCKLSWRKFGNMGTKNRQMPLGGPSQQKAYLFFQGIRLLGHIWEIDRWDCDWQHIVCMQTNLGSGMDGLNGL